jgi:hypothetical protein
VGAFANSVVGAFVDATALVDNLGWQRMLLVPVFFGACALAKLGIRRIEVSAEHRPPKFTFRAMALGAKSFLAIVIFVTAYAMSISLSGPELPLVMMLALLAAGIVTAIREVTKRRARVARLRS